MDNDGPRPAGDLAAKVVAILRARIGWSVAQLD
jgi:hypothetical protein